MLDGSYFAVWQFPLRILTGKNNPQIIFQCLRIVWLWAFGSFEHQKNSFQEVLKTKQNFQKNKVITGKTPFFVIGSWHGSLWKWCIFNLSTFNYRQLLQFFLKKVFVSIKFVSKLNLLIASSKHIFRSRTTFKNP